MHPDGPVPALAHGQTSVYSGGRKWGTGKLKEKQKHEYTRKTKLALAFIENLIYSNMAGPSKITKFSAK